MEVTVVETGDLPEGAVISFHTGSIRRHAQIEKNKCINVTSLNGTEPVRVDLMSRVGSHTFDMVPGQDVYDVPIEPTPGLGLDANLKLKFQIRKAPESEVADDAGDEAGGPGSPSKKLQTALMMRSYLDNHDVLRQMQELLQDMVSNRPDDPIDFMIQRLEEVCRDNHAVDYDLIDGDVAGTVVIEGDQKKGSEAAGSASAGQMTQPVRQQSAEESDSGGEGDEEEVPLKAPIRPTKSRREGVSAEAMKGGNDDWTPPVHEKTPEDRAELAQIIQSSHDSKLHMLFGTVSKDTFEQIVDAMFCKKIAKDENVIEQGAEGDYFYIVKRGKFDIYVKKGADPPKKVFQAGVGFAFGELALLYSCPRSATITAADDAEVWCLDRTAFRNLVVRSSEKKFNELVGFISNVDVFQSLSETEKSSLAEVLEEEEFDDDEAIVEQDEKDDKMFILRSGQAVACIKGEQGEVEVMQYQTGDYFGEIALLTSSPRKASVYATGKCTCLYITRPTFKRILGPLQQILERSIDKYSKYQDALEEDQSRPESNTESGKDAKPITKRKRERKAADEGLDKVQSHRVVKETQDSAPAETLADKVAQDFKNPALVTPSDAHAVKDAHMMLYGGLVPKQKFTMDKHIHVRTGFPMGKKGEDWFYQWQATTKLKQSTEISVICQKGQKSASDPTPNQDNFFIHHVGGVSMYGVCDGHGPFGHLVSFRLVQTLPYFLSTSEHFGKDWALALKHAFLDAQKDLEEFCAQHDVNIEASGAAGSVLVLEEQTVHIAYIGDARIMLGSWSKRDSRMIHCTKDHKPDLPEEKARLEAAGSEVREIDPGNHRIYLPGSNFPGLTMSRAFGDTACNGVLREPEYSQYLMQPTDQWYAVVASDGVWEFLEGEEVCTMTSKKLRLKGTRETTEFLVSASRKRWAYVCGDYCDDITAIMIQWNSASTLEGNNNHSLTVRQFEPPAE